MAKSTNVSATQKLLKHLMSGRGITSTGARSRFGIQNVSARISEFRKAGYAIILNEKTGAYRML